MAQRQILSMVFLALVSANVIQGNAIRSGYYRPYSIFPQVVGGGVVDNVNPIFSGLPGSYSYPYYPSLVGRVINGGILPSLATPGLVNNGLVNENAAASAAASASANGGAGVSPGYGYNPYGSYRPSFLRPILRRYWNNYGGVGGVPSIVDANSVAAAEGVPVSVAV